MPEVLVPMMTATRSAPWRAIAASTAGRICTSAASSRALLRPRNATGSADRSGSGVVTSPNARVRPAITWSLSRSPPGWSANRPARTCALSPPSAQTTPSSFR